MDDSDLFSSYDFSGGDEGDSSSTPSSSGFLQSLSSFVTPLATAGASAFVAANKPAAAKTAAAASTSSMLLIGGAIVAVLLVVLLIFKRK
jgi:hypothetical protein